MEFPEWWNKFQKTDDENERERVDFQNKIMSNKRPYFFKWLYDHYNRDYIKYSENYNDFCKSNFGITLKDFLDKKEKTKEEEKTEFYYQKYDRLISSQSVMNKICRVMETEVSLLKKNKKSVIYGFDVDNNKMPEMRNLYLKWKNSRKNYDKENENVLEVEIRTLADKISSKSNEIARLAMNTSMGFAISVFPDYVVDMYSSKTVEVPVLDNSGDIVFGGERFSIMELILNG